MSLKLTSFDPAYQDAIFELNHSAIHDIGLGLPSHEDFKDIPQKYIENDGDFIQVLDESDTLIGVGALRRFSEEAAEIKCVRIDKSAQGRGVGGKILERLEEIAEKLGYQKIVTDTPKQNEQSQGFFHKHGYETVGEKDFGAFTAVLLEKALKVKA